MHKCKSPSEHSLRPLGILRKAGFSLIEVSMALAIVAIAFVALIGLLPAGMKIFEAAANTTAETRMVSHLSSMLQATDYTEFRKGEYQGVLFYYDVDGGFLDTDKSPVPGYEIRRIYVAKLLVDAQNIPNGSATFDVTKTSSRVIVAMGRADPKVVEILNGLQDAQDVGEKQKMSPRIKTQAILVSRMDIEL
jgi:uncharacterized protein (TIGR02598 family)